MAAHPSTVSAPTAAPFSASPLLRFALKLDGAVSGATGLVHLVAAAPLADLFGIPEPWLRALGAFMLVYGVVAWRIGAAPRPVTAWAIVAGNVVWVDASIAVLVLGAWSPEPAGSVWIALQAAIVGVFAVLQFLGLRRS